MALIRKCSLLVSLLSFFILAAPGWASCEFSFLAQQDEQQAESKNKPKELTASERESIIERLATELRTKYVFPDTGEKMAQSVESSFSDGSYDSLKTTDQFANQLTEELRAICHDLHLRVRPGSPSRRIRSGRRPTNQHFGFARAEYLEGQIGYLKLNGFVPGEEAERVAAGAMNFLAGSRALIFDLRENGGGSPEMIEFLCGYLFDEKVHLNSFYNRPTETTTKTWSRVDVPGHRFGESIPVFVLTSQRTFSAAEEFTYDLKHLERATIVGETTGGGAHPVMPVTLGPRVFMTMPFARAINPVTQTNWEGKGVQPHVLVSASEALDEAIRLAQKQIEAKRSAATAEEDKSGDLSIGDLYRVANQLLSEQEFADASVAFRRITKRDEDQAQAWFLLGYCLHAEGKLDEAIEVHKRAAQFEPVAMSATYNLACAYALKSDAQRALTALQRAIDLGFDNVDQIEQDTDLDSLRDKESFRSLLQTIK